MSHLWGHAHRSQWRWAAALLLLANAAIHVSLAPMHLIEAPYIGVLFIALSTACVILAVLLTVVDNTLAWSATGAVSLLALIAFLFSRTIGLPQLRDDVGDWTDPLGYPNMAVEILTVAIATAVLRSRWRRDARTMY